MNVIVTIDDANGTMFNRRRQSRDRVLNERILKVCGGRLRVTPETAALFAGMQAELTVSPDPLAGAGEDDWIFSEGLPLAPHAGKIGKLILYRWNRRYPGDRFLDVDPAAMKLISTTDFAGSSHEKITEEVYIR